MPFRGSEAVQRGLPAERVLHGHRYRRMFPDIYLLASAPANLAARSLAAVLLAPEQGLLSGTLRRSCSVHNVRQRKATPS